MKKLVTKFKCAVCGKITSGRRPRTWFKGDGSFYWPRRHKMQNGEPCPGNIVEAEWVDIEVDIKKKGQTSYDRSDI